MSNMKEYFYDLHIHSALSPCGDDDMTPANIAAMANLKGLDIIAVSDHNTCMNCSAVKQCADEYGILVIPAMELNTAEEIHVLCLFKDIEKAKKFGEYVYSTLPEIKNKADIYGHQYVMDKNEKILDDIPKLLITASSIGISEVQQKVKQFGGISIPAHVDKNSYSLISVLGTIPSEYGFSAFEVSANADIEHLKNDFPQLCNKTILSSSDAHYLWQINERINSIKMSEKSIEAFFDAIKQE